MALSLCSHRFHSHEEANKGLLEPAWLVLENLDFCPHKADPFPFCVIFLPFNNRSQICTLCLKFKSGVGVHFPFHVVHRC